MTGTTTTLRLLSLRRLVDSSFTILACLLIAPAENTYYSRVSSKQCNRAEHVSVAAWLLGNIAKPDLWLQKDRNTAPSHPLTRRSQTIARA